MRTIQLIILNLCFCIAPFLLSAQAPSNDNCSTAQFITPDENGNICISGTNTNATADGIFNGCNSGAVVPLPPGGHQVWYTYVAGGLVNSITITPTGISAAQQVSVTVTNGNCSSGGLNVCNTAALVSDPASVVFTILPGTQIWFYVTSLVADGDFLVCVNSVTGPVAPGNSCSSATRICNKLDLTSTGSGIAGTGPTPSCFNTPPVRPFWYKFTAGTSGPLEFAAFTTGLDGFRWALFNTTTGCPGIEVACNSFYDPLQPFGFSTSVANCNTNPYCPPVNVIAGQTYSLMIDDTMQSNAGFNLNWNTNIQFLPTAGFDVDSIIGCGTLNLDFTNLSTYDAITTYFLDYGDGSSVYTGTGSNFILPSHIYGPGTYLVKLTLNQPGGCINSFARQIIVYDKPSSNFTTSVDSLCFNGITPVSFDFNSTYVSSTANYSWSYPNNSNIVSTGIGQNSVSWSTWENIPISLVISENGCASDTTKDSIIILNRPTADFLLSNNQICGKDTVLLTFNGSASSTATYNLFYGAATLISGNFPSPIKLGFPSQINYPLYLVITDHLCVSDTVRDTVFTRPLPLANAGIDTAMCSFDQINIGATPIIGLTYSWSPTTNLLGSNTSNPQVAIPNPGTTDITYTYFLTVTEGWCSNSDTINIAVHPRQSAYFLSPVRQCLNGNNFNFIPDGAIIPTAQFNWSFGPNANPDTANTVVASGIRFNASGWQQIHLMTKSKGCPTENYYDSVFVKASPLVSTAADIFAGCPPLKVSFTNQSPLYINASFLWNFGNGDTSSNENPIYSYTSSGVYNPTLTLTTQDTCSSTDTLNTEINVAPIPGGSFTVSPVLIYDISPLVNFNFPSPGVKCSYDFGDGFIDSICSTSHIYQDTGIYAVKLTTINSAGCIDSSTQFVYVRPYYTFYIPSAFSPNDDGKNDVLEFKSNGISEFEIQIFNRRGQIVFKSNDPFDKWNGHYLDTSTLCPEGVYVFIASSRDINKKKHSYNGKITLIR